MNETTAAALQAFQAKMGLTASGQIDQATRDALVREHGS
jgi:murein L,D-transpeptidase YcbB/YkuD